LDVCLNLIGVIKRADARPVYETGRGRLCPECGQPPAACVCGTTDPDSTLPSRLTCVLRRETKGRSGKAVTVVAGLPRNRAFLRQLAAELKQACGTGGTAGEDHIEIQGDQRERLRTLLSTRGYTVKG
jgi:translation initiation factor 1